MSRTDQAAEATVRAAVIHPLLSLLDHVAGDAGPILRRHGMSRAGLQDPYRLLPLRRYLELFAEAAALARDPSLGLHLGQGLRPDLLGPVGLVFNAAPTLRDGFEALARFLPAWQGGTRFLLSPEDGGAAACYRVDGPATLPRRQDAEFSLAITCGLVRNRLGPRWAPMGVRFEHPLPPDRTPHERFFRCPVSFGHATNALLVSEEDLERALPSPDRLLGTILEAHLHDLLDRLNRDGSVSGRAAFLIACRLGQEEVTVPRLATALGMPPRSLQRRLKDEGTSLRTLLREERLRVARSLLASGMTVEATARALGYADASVLSRAYRGWSGRPPRRPGMTAAI